MLIKEFKKKDGLSYDPCLVENTRIDRREAFINELHSFLKKYRVTISASDEWKEWPIYGRDIRICFEFDDHTEEDIEFENKINAETLK